LLIERSLTAPWRRYWIEIKKIKEILFQAWWCILVIPEWKAEEEDHELKSSLNYSMRSCLKKRIKGPRRSLNVIRVSARIVAET
jgi:hypothetical protein